MKNLAGVNTCDTDIRDELERARVPAVIVEKTRSEVPYTVEGRLGSFTFRRAWYYWMVSGDVPLAVAQELYADPIGRKTVRVAGHCGCPAPEDWVTLRDSDGREILPERQRAKWDEDCSKSEYIKKVCDEALTTKLRHERDAIGPISPVIDSYHIDDLAGLRLFADTLRKHGLAGDPS